MDYGKTMKTTLPSGRKITFRETNGDDDAILSTMSTAMSGDNVYNFLANIIIPESGEEKLLAADIAEWPINDKYVLLFRQRIFNHGKDFVFHHSDPNDEEKREVEYTEDLELVDKVIPNYPGGEATHMEFISPSSKKKFRIRIVTGLMEDKAAKTPPKDQNKNSQLTDREIELWNDNNEWERLLSFRKLTSKEMVELRVWVNKVDEQFDPIVHIKNEFTGATFNIPLMAMPTFYFPEGTI